MDIDLQHAIPLLAATSVGAWWLSGSEGRAKQAQYAEWESQQKQYQAERERLAYIEPKDTWTVDELAQYNGEDENGPILMAVKGDVYNVWKGRNFYGVGGEYHIMAGRDATRFLAKNRLEEESEEQLKIELNIAERANLEVSYVYEYHFYHCNSSQFKSFLCNRCGTGQLKISINLSGNWKVTIRNQLKCDYVMRNIELITITNIICTPVNIFSIEIHHV